MTAEWAYLGLGPLSDLAWTSFHSRSFLGSLPRSARSRSLFRVRVMTMWRALRSKVSPPTTHTVPNSSTTEACEERGAGKFESPALLPSLPI